MPHDGSGTGWDIAAPADTDPRKDGAQEIRDLRTGTAIRVNKEHVTLASSSAGGEHKEGSAKAYLDDSGGSAPANRPDGTTPLDADDEGRMLFRHRRPFFWTGTKWRRTGVHGGTVTLGAGTTFSALQTIGCNWRAIHFFGNNGINFTFVSNGPVQDSLTAETISAPFVSGGVVTAATFEINYSNPTIDENAQFQIRSLTGGFGGTTLRYVIIPYAATS